MDQIREEFGGIDILVNYAGLSPEEGPDGDKAKDFKRLMEYNVEAVFNCSRAPGKNAGTDTRRREPRSDLLRYPWRKS